MTNPTTLRAECAEALAKGLPPGADDRDRLIARRFFYAGASSTLSMVHDACVLHDRAKGAAALRAMGEEVSVFADVLMAGGA